MRLVVLQFTISIALIVGTGIVHQQMDFIYSTDLGYNHDQIITVAWSGQAVGKVLPAEGWIASQSKTGVCGLASFSVCFTDTPIIQHSLNIMLELYKQGLISLEKIVEKMCHNVASLYHIEKRGFIREGYLADLTLVDLDSLWTVSKENILYKCGWSPLEGVQFQTRVTHTIVNGNLVYHNGRFNETVKGYPLAFDNKSSMA